MKISAFDRMLAGVSPAWALNRVKARAALDIATRHYEAAQAGRRTETWNKDRGDGNAVVQNALAALRVQARDMERNNAWARRALQVFAHNTVGWGIHASPVGADTSAAAEVWNKWADSVDCDADGQRTLYGLQNLIVKSVHRDGEVLVRRRNRRPEDGLPIPFQIQVLEADYIDSSRDYPATADTGPTIQGIEFDLIGRRNAYWLFGQHPGSNVVPSKDVTSKRVPASEILHIFDGDRAGQVRGASSFSAAILTLRDYDEYEDATMMRQKIAACFAGFITDADGGAQMGAESTQTDNTTVLEPGQINTLPDGKKITFANPPAVTEDSFSTRKLRQIAAALGVTYEDMTGDYSLVNFSSARMARIAHWQNVSHWQENVLIAQFCKPVWAWAMTAAYNASLIRGIPEGASWSAPPMPMIEPDKEGLALQRLVRVGALTHADMLRQLGKVPEAHWKEYSAGLEQLKALGIKLDSNVADVSQAGLTQERAGGSGPGAPSPAENEDRSASDQIAWEKLLDLIVRSDK